MISVKDRVWKLGHVYDMTEYFDDLVKNKQIVGMGDNCYKHGYFICHDVLDTHIYRIQVGINSEYEKEDRTKIVETENIHHEDLVDFCIEKYDLDVDDFDVDIREQIEILIQKIGLNELLKTIVEIDDMRGYENYDVDEFRYDTPLESLIEKIDGGYGITKYQELEENMECDFDYEL